MKKTLLLLSVIAFCFFSCMKDNDPFHTENITKGSKWTLTIGSSPAQVYSQLQTLGLERNFSSIIIVGRKPYSKPEDMQDMIGFYNGITVISNDGVIDGASIQLIQDTVNSIDAGNGMLYSVSFWPQDISDKEAIQVSDSITEMYQKLLNIFLVPKYSSYQIFLSDKPLNKPFDPDMSIYEEWGFGFSETISTEIARDYSVDLFFKDNKLVKIISSFRDLKMTP